MQMALWNIKNLQPPPVWRCKTVLKEIDLKVLHNTLQQGHNLFANQKQLHKEGALLGRFIYRMKTKFRSSKDFKVLEKLNNALLNYLHANMTDVIHQFTLSVPLHYTSKEMYLPSKNMLDYILVRLQGLGKLLLRIVETCKIACEMYVQRLRLGHFWKNAVIAFGISSRFFVICKFIIKEICNLYCHLISVRPKFSNSDCHVEWLPQNYHLPETLNEWLEIDWKDIESVIEIADEETRDISIFDLIEDSDDEIQISDEYILIKDDELSFTDRLVKFKKSISHEDDFDALKFFDNSIDIGEEVSEDEFLNNLKVEEVKVEDSPISKDRIIKFKKMQPSIEENKEARNLEPNAKNRRFRNNDSELQEVVINDQESLVNPNFEMIDNVKYNSANSDDPNSTPRISVFKRLGGYLHEDAPAAKRAIVMKSPHDSSNMSFIQFSTNDNSRPKQKNQRTPLRKFNEKSKKFKKQAFKTKNLKNSKNISQGRYFENQNNSNQAGGKLLTKAKKRKLRKKKVLDNILHNTSYTVDTSGPSSSSNQVQISKNKSKGRKFNNRKMTPNRGKNSSKKNQKYKKKISDTFM